MPFFLTIQAFDLNYTNSLSMNFKIDTKEKFREIVPVQPVLTAILAEELAREMPVWMENAPFNLILDLANVNEIEDSSAAILEEWQDKFYQNHLSFVICNLHQSLEDKLDELGILENLNVTPTLSEAWDIVQIEEIERELLEDFDDDPIEEE